ncbi:hypothetical protein IAU60_006021 [Kwoniella sp. DSM 27419]
MLTARLPRTLASTARSSGASSCRRGLAATSVRLDILNELEKQLHPRELIERKRRAFEEKYGDKLKRKIEAEGVQDLDALKTKVLAPSVRDALKAKKARSAIAEEALEKQAEASKQLGEAADRTAGPQAAANSAARPAAAPVAKTARVRSEGEQKQAEGDRSGIKPLSSILNLPLLHLTPHDAGHISQIWTAYHTAHPTLSNSYLSATLPSSTYASMLKLAKENPFFVLPLPRLAESSAEGTSGDMVTDEYEMFYLQWLFHPTPTGSSPPSAEANPAPLPLTTSVIFTPLEEFKKQGEWAQPYLVLTHYPDMAQSHDLVLMRGEISPAAATGPQGSLANPGFLLSQQQAQLLALALQRFYCTGIELANEGDKGRKERSDRAAALRGFRERPGEWDWAGLVGMAYGGLV